MNVNKQPSHQWRLTELNRLSEHKRKNSTQPHLLLHSFLLFFCICCYCCWKWWWHYESLSTRFRFSRKKLLFFHKMKPLSISITLLLLLLFCVFSGIFPICLTLMDFYWLKLYCIYEILLRFVLAFVEYDFLFGFPKLLNSVLLFWNGWMGHRFEWGF